MPPKPKLTKEEKKLLKIAKKEAARLKKIEDDKQRRRDFLAREVKYTETNSQKILEKWRVIMKRVRQPDLYDDYLSLQRSIEHQFDIKDSVIQMWLQMLDEGNEQFNMNFSQHVETINTMIGIYATCIDAMNLWYRSQLDNFAEKLSTFETNFTKDAERRKLHLEMIMWSMDDRTKERRMNLLADTTAKFDEETAKSGERLQSLKANLELQQENLWMLLQNTLNEHLTNTAERRRIVSDMMAVDTQAAAIIQSQRKKTERAYDSIRKLNETLAEVENSRPTTLLEECESLKSAHSSLQSWVDRSIARDNYQMAHLVFTSSDVLQELKTTVKEGERIIRFLNLCRRLETENEKVLPFPEWAYGDEDQEDEGYDDQNDSCRTEDDVSSGLPESLMTHSLPLHAELEEEPGELGCLCVPIVADPSSKKEKEGTPMRSKDYMKRLEKQVCKLSPPISLSKTSAELKHLEPFWGRVGRVNLDVIDLGDVVNNLRSENADLKAELMCYVRMGATSSMSLDPQSRVLPAIPLMKSPPGPRGKYKLLPPVETRL